MTVSSTEFSPHHTQQLLQVSWGAEGRNGSLDSKKTHTCPRKCKIQNKTVHKNCTGPESEENYDPTGMQEISSRNFNNVIHTNTRDFKYEIAPTDAEKALSKTQIPTDSPKEENSGQAQERGWLFEPWVHIHSTKCPIQGTSEARNKGRDPDIESQRGIWPSSQGLHAPTTDLTGCILIKSQAATVLTETL